MSQQESVGHYQHLGWKEIRHALMRDGERVFRDADSGTIVFCEPDGGETALLVIRAQKRSGGAEGTPPPGSASPS